MSTDLQNFYYVYKITFPNGKIYIGSDTSCSARLNIPTYWGSIRKAAREEILKFLNSCGGIKEGTVVSSEKEILSIREVSSEEMKTRILMDETYYIKEYESLNPDIGYNLKIPIKIPEDYEPDMYM